MASLALKQFNSELLDFLDNSPTPFHAVANMRQALLDAGFIQLYEIDKWQLTPGKRYFVIRNNSSIIAFTLGKTNIAESGVRLIGAHTDSPCLKVKPNPELKRKDYFQLGVEVYGGVLLGPWFDRDLSLAGRVNYSTASGKVESTLINFKRPIAVIPSLAIHLDREVNQNRSIDFQKHLPPILLQPSKSGNVSLKQLLSEELKAQKINVKAEKILEYELFFYDTQAPSLLGVNQEFISSARLDNLLSCFVALKAITASASKATSLIVCNDHEEIGSVSASGAQGPFLKSVLQRLTANHEDYVRCTQRSLLISADNAHGIHPNFMDKHDENHGPILNQGPVIKINANQRYATNSETSAFFRHLCQQAKVNVQSYVVRSDMACGSTIGPLTAAETGIQTIDVGVPTFAMHSIRELAGSSDAYSLYKVARLFVANN